MAHFTLFQDGSGSLQQTFRWVDAEPAALDIDLRHGLAGKGHQHGGSSARRSDLEEGSGAEVVACDHPADCNSVRALRGKATEIGVIRPLSVPLDRGRARVGACGSETG